MDTKSEKIRKSRLGKKHSIKTIRKISETSKRRVFSKEVRDRMIQGNIRVNGKMVKCIETGVIYDSISEASRDYNTSPICISRVCNGVRESFMGIHFEFL